MFLFKKLCRVHSQGKLRIRTFLAILHLQIRIRYPACRYVGRYRYALCKYLNACEKKLAKGLEVGIFLQNHWHRYCINQNV